MSCYSKIADDIDWIKELFGRTWPLPPVTWSVHRTLYELLQAFCYKKALECFLKESNSKTMVKGKT